MSNEEKTTQTVVEPSWAYAGIGSRSTPEHVLREMTRVANNLEYSGFTLRSGGAAGADSAFEKGVVHADHKEIFLPWKNFNGNKSPYWGAVPQAHAIAEQYHPAWDRCGQAARKFHARNTYQILGWHLNKRSDFVLCWTPGGRVTGGTGQALRIAQDWNVPVFNMFHDDWEVGLNALVKKMMEAPVSWTFEEGEEVAL